MTLQAHAEWLEAHHTWLRKTLAEAGLASGNSCEAQPQPEPPEGPQSPPEPCATNARIAYLTALIECLYKPVAEQSACCTAAYLKYVTALWVCEAGSGG